MTAQQDTSRTRRAVRRALRPFLSPVDGRVADINRRISAGHASVHDVERRLGQLTERLDAYATATLESNAYIGAEIGRVDASLAQVTESLAGMRERLAIGDNQRYIERLDLARRAALEHLEDELANVINYANGHKGFAAQAGLWFNPPVTVQLGKGEARLGDVNERLVELPFAFGALARLDPPARILDIGAAESTFSFAAASLGYEVTALDLHQLPFVHPKLNVVVGRFEDWDPGPVRFDAIFFISTLEHFGLGAYGEGKGAPDADQQALARIRDLLTERGILVLTTPYGSARVDLLERIYDHDGLATLLTGWKILTCRLVYRRDRHTWGAAEPENETSSGVAMLVAQPSR